MFDDLKMKNSYTRKIPNPPKVEIEGLDIKNIGKH